jgi:hypothetical protein
MKPRTRTSGLEDGVAAAGQYDVAVGTVPNAGRVASKQAKRRYFFMAIF